MTKTLKNNFTFNLTKGVIMIKSLIRTFTTLLISGFIFADGVYESYDIPSFKYKTLQINGNDLLNLESEGDNTSISIDAGATYNFMSQSAGENCSYGVSFNFDMDDTGVEGVDATTNWDVGLQGSMEKYMEGYNKATFVYADAEFDMVGGDAITNNGVVDATSTVFLRTPFYSMFSSQISQEDLAEGVDMFSENFTEDDPMNLYVNIGAGYGRVVNQRPVAEAYAVADALGDTSDETVLAIAEVIGAKDSYASIHKDNADEMYYNDIAAAAGNSTAAMKVQKILTSPAYQIADRSGGYSARVGFYNNFLQADCGDDCDQDKGDLVFGGEYAMPLDMNKQISFEMGYSMGLNDLDMNMMLMMGSFSMAHSYNWLTSANIGYMSLSTTGFEDAGANDFTVSNLMLGLQTTKAILNKCSVTGSFGYLMSLDDGDDVSSNDPDPTMNMSVAFTYWVF